MGDKTASPPMSRSRSTGRRPGARPAAATILDVARRAGVSTATVSRALAAPDRVAEETRSKVIAAIAATGYTPNASARNLRARSTKIVLALLPGMSNTFFTPILNAIEDTLSAAGYGMIIGDTRNSRQKEAHYTRFILAGQVDGVILFTGHLPRDGDLTPASDRVPIALVCNEIVGDDRYSIFDVDNRDAARRATAHLIAAGHRHIGHIAGERDNVEARERLRGFRDALEAAGHRRPTNPRSGAAASASRTASPPPPAFLALRKRPTAVFASADDGAIGFIRTVRDAGIRTPEDVSVVASTTSTMPASSTRRSPPCASRAPSSAGSRPRICLRRMRPDAPDLPPTRARLRCELIERRERPADRRARASGKRSRRRADDRLASRGAAARQNCRRDRGGRSRVAQVGDARRRPSRWPSRRRHVTYVSCACAIEHSRDMRGPRRR